MASFKDILTKDDKPVLVDFWAEWCGPCHALAPTIKQVKQHYGDKLRVLKIDVDKNQQLSGSYQIQSVPTLILFKGGEPVWRQSGALPFGAITQAVDAHVG